MPRSAMAMAVSDAIARDFQDSESSFSTDHVCIIDGMYTSIFMFELYIIYELYYIYYI